MNAIYTGRIQMKTFLSAFAIFALACFLASPVSADPAPPNPCGNHGNNCETGSPTETTNTNTNDNTAVGVGVGIGIAGARSSSGSASFSGSNSAAEGGDASSDQQQSQNTDVHAHASNRVNNSNSTDSNSTNSNNSSTGDDTVTVTTNANHQGSAASSAAAIVIGSCSKGVSAQSHMGGGSMASPDEVCLLFSLSSMYRLHGNIELSDKALADAAQILRFRNNPVRRSFQAIPLIGNIF